MKFLLDTHSFLWFIGGHTNLSPTARKLIEEVGNQPLLSIVSLWEMAIKLSLGKLALAQAFEELIPQQIQLNGIEVLAIEVEHLAEVVKLPFHHRDPFDRLLIAQAMVEQISIVGADSQFDAYAVKRLW